VARQRPGPGRVLVLLPDGKRIVWTSTRDHLDFPVGDWSDSDNYPQGGELYVSDWKGKNVKRMTNNKYYEAEVSVSPDGEWITFGRQIDGKMDICDARVDTGKFQTRTDDGRKARRFHAGQRKHHLPARRRPKE
jgi:Tol biopolymer transport system component